MSKVTNLEYLYLDDGYYKQPEQIRPPVQPQPPSSDCGKYDCCKECQYSKSNDCIEIEQNDIKDINRLINRIKSRLNGTSYVEECGCDEERVEG